MLNQFTRNQLEFYMTDCHGFDVEQLKEWDTKTDLAADIRAFGWADSCIQYLTN